uniref:WGS project CAEQ00000000 data, annotated contig 1010 n=1 Tax=Trypanosoma congolense (strain IL3000) TaxID=1068625 RepID=F9W369_TRYCI|nr:unnamed protein product [Trypanosoma congolense IL3000]
MAGNVLSDGTTATDRPEQLVEALLDCSWLTQGVELFAEELKDLEQLEESESKVFQMQRTELCDVSDMGRDSYDGSSASQDRRTGLRMRKSPTVPKVKGLDPSLSRGSCGTGWRGSGSATTLTTSPMARQEKIGPATSSRGYDSCFQALQLLKQKIRQVRDEMDHQRSLSLRQLRYFTARNLEEYLPNEVLLGVPERTRRFKSGTSTAGGSDEECIKPMQREDAASCVSTNAGDSRSIGTAVYSPCGSATSLPVALDFVIDSTNFISDLNAALERNYGVVNPLTEGRRSVGFGQPSPSTKRLSTALSVHRPGNAMELGEPAWLCSVLPPIAPVNGGSTAVVSGEELTDRCVGEIDMECKDTRGGKRGPKLPQLKSHAGGDGWETSGDLAQKGGKAKGVAASPAQIKPVGSTSIASNMDAPIRCSAVGNSVNLRTNMGVEVSTVVRFSNDTRRRLNIRLQRASHPWLKYSIVGVSAGKHLSEPTGVCIAVDAPLNYCEYVDVRLTFQPDTMKEPSINEVLRLGYCLDLNSRGGEGGFWSFHEVSVQCETILPEFRLVPLEGMPSVVEGSSNVDMVNVLNEAPSRAASSGMEHVTTVEFPCTFVLNSFTRYFYLENVGSSATVALSTSSPAFRVALPAEGAIEIPSGNAVCVAVCFCPVGEVSYEAEHLYVSAKGGECGPVVAKRSFGLKGKGVLPRIELLRVGTLGLSSYCGEKNGGIRHYFLPDTTPGVEAVEEVVARNNCPMTVEFVWQVLVVGGGLTEVDLHITPHRGVLPPFEETSFLVTVKPSTAEPVAAVLNLFLEGLPMLPSEARERGWKVELAGAPLDSCAGGPNISEEVTRSLTRNRMLPALPGIDLLRQMMDPCNAFQQYMVQQPLDTFGVFAGGFYLFADPLPPRLMIIPSCFEEGLDCLIHGENARRVMLQNSSQRPLHFIFDPQPNEYPPGVCFASTYDPNAVDVRFEPRTGCVPPYGSTSVTFFYTLKEIGFHAMSVNCYVPELSDHAECVVGAVQEVPCTYKLHLKVMAVGPSLTVSTNVLDFGLIEHGRESEASFTVTNDNPIPVMFKLQDPMAREPPRFVFLPEAFCLGAGESVEVTVYRQALDVNESQIFFELVVHNGGTIAIETRADIQKQMLELRETTVNYGVVPNGSWTTKYLVLSNPFAFDIPYSVNVVTIPPHIAVNLPPPGVVRAGCLDVHIPIQCSFSICEAGGENKALLCVKNMRVPQDMPIELCCDTVKELAVTVDLIHIPSACDQSNPAVYTPSTVGSALPPVPEMQLSSYIESLLWNLVELQVLGHSEGSKMEHKNCTDPVHATVIDGPSTCGAKETVVAMLGGKGTVLRPYCSPLSLQAILPDREPVLSELAVLRIQNLTGCHSTYDAACTQYSVVEALYNIRSSPRQHRTSVRHTKRSKSISPTLPRRRTVGGGRSASPHRATGGRSLVSDVNNKHPSPQLGLAALEAKREAGGLQSSFWCKNLDGAERREFERRAALAGAQDVLLDGRGFAPIFGGLINCALGPFADLKIPISFCANLPGRYEETLRVRCGTMPPMNIPVALELRGKPLLLDAATAGHLTTDGKEVLLMPSVLAGVGRSQRTVRLVNRLPRDVNVTFNIFLTNVTLSVFAVDEDVAANEVTLRVGPVTEEDHRLESEAKGQVASVPGRFFLPALGSQLVMIEYAPSANFIEQGSVEREWRGGVIITSEFAETSFNDSFIIDEFYRTNTRYRPIERILRKQTRDTDACWSKSLLHPIAVLKVQHPSITRAGVVKNGSVIIPDLADAKIRNQDDSSRSKLLVASDVSQLAHTSSTDDDSSDSDKEDLRADAKGLQRCTPQSQAIGTVTSSSDSVDEERAQLLAFIEKRRRDLAEYSRRFLIPIELELQARCGLARLAVEPSENLVKFPTCVDGERCTQTILLTNLSCALIAFMIDLPSQSFRVVETRFISMDEEYRRQEAENEKTKLSRKAVENLKWCSLEERRRARRVLARGKSKEHTDKGVTQVLLERHPTLTGSPVSCHGKVSSGVTVTKYQLFPHDALQVVIEYHNESKDDMDRLACEGATLTGELDILYLPSVSSILDQQQGSVTDNKKAFHPPPVVELKQSIPLSLTFAKPSVSCTPSFLWFFPGQQLHDGRKQQHYKQKLQLVSTHPSPLTFKIVLSDTSSHLDLVPARCNAPSGLCSRDPPSTKPQVLNGGMTVKADTSAVFSRERKLHELGTYIRDDGAPIVEAAITEERSVAHHGEKLSQWVNGCLPQGGRGDAVEDPSRFTVTPMEGTIPSATRGGQPGVFEIYVDFQEHSNMRFESAFDVFIGCNHTRACSFFVRGDSRDTEM